MFTIKQGIIEYFPIEIQESALAIYYHELALARLEGQFSELGRVKQKLDAYAEALKEADQ